MMLHIWRRGLSSLVDATLAVIVTRDGGRRRDFMRMPSDLMSKVVAWMVGNVADRVCFLGMDSTEQVRRLRLLESWDGTQVATDVERRIAVDDQTQRASRVDMPVPVFAIDPKLRDCLPKKCMPYWRRADKPLVLTGIKLYRAATHKLEVVFSSHRIAFKALSVTEINGLLQIDPRVPSALWDAAGKRLLYADF